MYFKKLLEFFKNVFVRFVIWCLPVYHFVLVCTLRHKKKINVVFFAMSLSMWRYQHLYEEMLKYSKFNPTIVIYPPLSYDIGQKQREIAKLMEHFDNSNISYVLGDNNIRRQLKPDILFYPQPYPDFYPEDVSFKQFYDRLLCYSPYAFWMSKGGWSYNQPLHIFAWKLFYPNLFHKNDARVFSIRMGRNMEIVGYPTADDFLRGNYTDIWRKQTVRKKRVIWAPHFTIFSGGYVKQSTFMQFSEFMLGLAQKYSDQLQFVFKPHPRLYSELCKHPDWGEEKARQYYEQWETMGNTQVETGEFVDLFMKSDAMIHDCGSFAVEYHYTENPVMYIAQNFEEQVAEKNDFGKLAMKLHYVGKCKEDIVEFIENVVLHGEDHMKPQRQQFKREYLLPPNGKTVAENTMDVFLKAFC